MSATNSAARVGCNDSAGSIGAARGAKVSGGGAEAVSSVHEATDDVITAAVSGTSVKFSRRDHQPEDDQHQKGDARALARPPDAQSRCPVPPPNAALAAPRWPPTVLRRITRCMPSFVPPRSASVDIDEEAPPPCEVSGPASLVPRGGSSGAADAPGFPCNEPHAVGSIVRRLVLASRSVRLARGFTSVERVVHSEPPPAPRPPVAQGDDVHEKQHRDQLVGDAHIAAQVAAEHVAVVLVGARGEGDAADAVGSSSAVLPPRRWPPLPSAAASRAGAALRRSASATLGHSAGPVASAELVSHPAIHIPSVTRATPNSRAKGSVASLDAGRDHGGSGVVPTVLWPCSSSWNSTPTLRPPVRTPTLFPRRRSVSQPALVGSAARFCGAALAAALAWAPGAVSARLAHLTRPLPGAGQGRFV